MKNKAFELMNKYALELVNLTDCDPESLKILFRFHGRIYETEDGCDFRHLRPEDIAITNGAMGSSYPIERKILRENREMHAIVLSNTTYCKSWASYGKTLTAAVDDMAQIIGPKAYVVHYDEKAVKRALSKAAGCFVRGRYTLTMGRNLYEAVVALTVLEKSAEINTKAVLLGGAKSLPLYEAKLMRMNYKKKYSKAEQEVKAEEGK